MSPLRQRMVPIPAVRVPCPAAQRRGHGQRGRLLFGDFLSAGDRWRRKRQVTAPPGAHSGTRPWQKHAAIPAVGFTRFATHPQWLRFQSAANPSHGTGGIWGGIGRGRLNKPFRWRASVRRAVS